MALLRRSASRAIRRRVAEHCVPTQEHGNEGKAPTRFQGYLPHQEPGEIRSATEPSISRTEQKELRDLLGKIAVQLADQVKADLASPDAAIASAAKQARDSLVANANFSDLLWKGYGVNSRVVREDSRDSADVKCSVIYESVIILRQLQ